MGRNARRRRGGRTGTRTISPRCSPRSLRPRRRGAARSSVIDDSPDCATARRPRPPKRGWAGKVVVARGQRKAGRGRPPCAKGVRLLLAQGLRGAIVELDARIFRASRRAQIPELGFASCGARAGSIFSSPAGYVAGSRHREVAGGAALVFPFRPTVRRPASASGVPGARTTRTAFAATRGARRKLVGRANAGGRGDGLYRAERNPGSSSSSPG